VNVTDVGEISAAYEYLGALVAKYWGPVLHYAYWSIDDDDSPFHMGCGCGRPAVAGLREALSPSTPTSGEVNPDGNWERGVAELLAEVRGLDRVGVTDDFFALGGTSSDLVRLQEAVVGGSWSRR
jgi:hypothetical protein